MRRPPLKIAWFGLAQRDGGSGLSGEFLALRELLVRGHEIDFFGNVGYVYPRELEVFPNFRFVQVSSALSGRLHRIEMAMPGRTLRAAWSQFRNKADCATVIRRMRAEHRNRQYDLELFSNAWAFGRIPGVPVVSWVQGPPNTDSRSIARHSRQVIDLCGRKDFLLLRAYAGLRQTLDLPPFRHTDRILCGSEWSAGAIAEHGIPAVRIDALPYPVDLNLFSPLPRPARSADHVPTVLWLGRVVPRKRLDLFLEACEILLERGMQLRVKVFGGFAFVPGYRKLLERFRHPQALEYRERIDRKHVPELLREADVLIQPSEEENFGASIAEALACGTPVVAGPTNGTAEYIGAGGVRFAAYQPAAVAGAIATVLAARAADPAFGAKERQAAEEAFDTGRVVDRLEPLLYDALGAAGPEAKAAER